jgi:DNA-directed RNA polymerase subunit F
VNSIAIARHAELRGLALKLQAQDLAQESALVTIQQLLVYIEDLAQNEELRVMARLAMDHARKAQDCEKQDVLDHRKLGDLLGIPLHDTRKEKIA